MITADSLITADALYTADGAGAVGELVVNAPDRHASLLKALLPPVSYDPMGPAISAQLDAEGAALDDALAASLRVLATITPDGDTELLPDWERVYGLPDACLADIDSSVSSRVAAVIDKIRRGGGMSRQFFIDLAAALGYAISIVEFSPFTVSSLVTYPLYDVDSQYWWQISLPTATPPRPFSVLDSVMTPLVVYQTGLLECLLQKLKPAHTELQFVYV